MSEERRTIPKEKILELGGIHGFLRSIQEGGMSDDTPASAATPVLPDTRDRNNEDERPAPALPDKPVQKASEEAADKPKTTTGQKDDSPSGQHGGNTQRPAVRSSARTSKGSWGGIMSVYKSYDKPLNSGNTVQFRIDKDAADTVRSCFGRNAARFINALIIWSIDNHRDSLITMLSGRGILLREGKQQNNNIK